MERRVQQESKGIRNMYNSLLDSEMVLRKDVERIILEKEFSDLRKREVLHKKWNDRVYEPLRKKLITTLTPDAVSASMNKRRDLHIEYLELLNRKGHVFLDTYPPDYFPLGLVESRVNTMSRRSGFNDPLLSQQRDRFDEERTLLRCQSGHYYSNSDLDDVRLPTLPLGRQGTDCTAWLTIPYHYIESPVRVASRAKMRSDNNISHFEFKNWGRCKDQNLIDSEMNIKRLGHSNPRPVTSIPMKDMVRNHMRIPVKS